MGIHPIIFPCLFSRPDFRAEFAAAFPGILMLSDKNHRLIAVSANFRDVAGFDPAEILGRTPTECFGSEIGAMIDRLHSDGSRAATRAQLIAFPTPASRIWCAWAFPFQGMVVVAAIPECV